MHDKVLPQSSNRSKSETGTPDRQNQVWNINCIATSLCVTYNFRGSAHFNAALKYSNTSRLHVHAVDLQWSSVPPKPSR
eukprot:4465935-Amphidinium_carterae.1